MTRLDPPHGEHTSAASGFPTLRFSTYELDFARRELRRAGAVVELQPTPRRVLLHLAQHRDRTVPRQELLDVVWPGVVVGDEALTTALAEVRRAIGDDGAAQRSIRTLKGEGYRFVAEVVEAPGEDVAARDGVETQADGSPRDEVLGIRQVPHRARRGRIAVAVGALALGGVIGVASWTRPAPPAPAEPKPLPYGVAVLPIANLTGDAKEQPLADGLTEQITHSLSQNGYPVVARTTTEQWRERGADVRQLGEQLGVSHVLEGSVRRSGERVRVTIQLVATDSGKHVWSEELDATGDDAFAIQQRVSDRVSVRVYHYVSEDIVALKRDQAYQNVGELLVRGRSLSLEGRWQDSLAVGERLLDALPADERFDAVRSQVHAAMSYSWANLFLWGPVPLSQAGPEMLKRAEAAVSIAPESAFAHHALSRALTHHWRWEEAEREMHRACELMPRDGFCGSQMLLICAAIGCFDEMLAGARLQRQQAPASAYGPYDLSGALMVNGKLDEAAAVALRGREQFDLIGGLAQPNILWRLGLYAEAVESRSWLAAAVGNGEAAGEIARRGAREARDAWRWAAEQQAGGRLEYPNVNDTLAARTYAELGELELALAALERAVAEHEPFPEFLGMDPIFFPLLDEPRFQALLEKMGLAAYRENYVKHARALAELKVQPMPQASPPR